MALQRGPGGAAMILLDAYVAVLAALAVGGVFLIVAGLAGGPAPTTPSDAPIVGRVRRFWRDLGGTPAERRTRQVLLVAAAVVAVLVFVLTGVPAVALLAGVAVPGVPWLWGVGKREQRGIERAEALGDWTRRLKDQLSTGAGLMSAIVNTTEAAPPIIAEEVGALAARLRTGADPKRALHRFAEELDDPIAEQVVAALLLHLQDRGEHLADVLAAIAADAGKQVSIRREVHAKRTQPRITVRFMTVFGLVIAAILARGELIEAYTSARGQLVLLVLASAFVATLVWVRSLSRPPAQPRFLRPPEVA
ncbi:type II secretion system F family protein [Natronosporangium hydrolyticum]|uniref:Type II secretion system F family protein n=1 Tax=Natronosporangium hydrolyticum TaxID=2811111 RepID=A0A895YAX5_9ACTN|nr:type II secretion system F family protein [Natronosporangium hydrolyticum]QSB14924.1 type II secretion system F family protein [Natronosporangium hydrolyticum]